MRAFIQLKLLGARILANSAQAKKRAKQAESARARNASQRSAMRTAVKKVLHAIHAQDQSTANEAFKQASRLLDRSARKGLIHKNKAARLKSRINTKIKAISA